MVFVTVAVPASLTLTLRFVGRLFVLMAIPETLLPAKVVHVLCPPRTTVDFMLAEPLTASTAAQTMAIAIGKSLHIATHPVKSAPTYSTMVVLVPMARSAHLGFVSMVFVVKARATVLARPVFLRPQAGPTVNARTFSMAKIHVMFAQTKVPLRVVPMVCVMEREVAGFMLMAPRAPGLNAVVTTSMETPRA